MPPWSNHLRAPLWSLWWKNPCLHGQKPLTTKTPSHQENIYKTLCLRASVVKLPPCYSVISVVKNLRAPLWSLWWKISVLLCDLCGEKSLWDSVSSVVKNLCETPCPLWWKNPCLHGQKPLTTKTPSHQENIYKTLCLRTSVVKSPPCSSVSSVVKNLCATLCPLWWKNPCLHGQKPLTTKTPSHQENIYKTLCLRASVVKSPLCSSVSSVVKKSVPPWWNYLRGEKIL